MVCHGGDGIETTASSGTLDLSWGGSVQSQKMQHVQQVTGKNRTVRVWVDVLFASSSPVPGVP
jgi:hypothetical protein